MMYPYMTLSDETEIVHSELKPDGRVKVYIEKPDEQVGFLTATCWLPDYTWENSDFSQKENDYLQKLMETNAHIILDYASKGGFENASNL